MATIPSVSVCGRASHLWRKTLPYFGTGVRKDLVVEEGAIPSEKYHCRWTSLRGKKPKWILHKFGHLLRPLKLLPASHEQVVPTEWQVRTIFGDFVSKARVITCQAPRYRQCALISDVLHLASLSKREEAAVTTNWIKDRPEGMKLQNLKATMTGPVLSSLPRNLTADVQ